VFFVFVCLYLKLLLVSVSLCASDHSDPFTTCFCPLFSSVSHFCLCFSFYSCFAIFFKIVFFVFVCLYSKLLLVSVSLCASDHSDQFATCFRPLLSSVSLWFSFYSCFSIFFKIVFFVFVCLYLKLLLVSVSLCVSDHSDPFATCFRPLFSSVSLFFFYS